MKKVFLTIFLSVFISQVYAETYCTCSREGTRYSWITEGGCSKASGTKAYKTITVEDGTKESIVDVSEAIKFCY